MSIPEDFSWSNDSMNSRNFLEKSLLIQPFLLLKCRDGLLPKYIALRFKVVFKMLPESVLTCTLSTGILLTISKSEDMICMINAHMKLPVV